MWNLNKQKTELLDTENRLVVWGWRQSGVGGWGMGKSGPQDNRYIPPVIKKKKSPGDVIHMNNMGTIVKKTVFYIQKVPRVDLKVLITRKKLW